MHTVQLYMCQKVCILYMKRRNMQRVDKRVGTLMKEVVLNRDMLHCHGFYNPLLFDEIVLRQVLTLNLS